MFFGGNMGSNLNYTREYGRNNPYEKEEEYSYIKLIPIYGEKERLKRALTIDDNGVVTERECDRLLTGSQPKGCGGSTPPHSAKIPSADWMIEQLKRSREMYLELPEWIRKL